MVTVKPRAFLVHRKESLLSSSDSYEIPAFLRHGVSEASFEMWKQMTRVRGEWKRVRITMTTGSSKPASSCQEEIKTAPLVEHVADVLRDAMHAAHAKVCDDLIVQDTLKLTFSGKRSVPHVDQTAINEKGQRFLMDTALPLDTVLFLKPRSKWAKSSSVMIAVAFELIESHTYTHQNEMWNTAQ